MLCCYFEYNGSYGGFQQAAIVSFCFLFSLRLFCFLTTHDYFNFLQTHDYSTFLQTHEYSTFLQAHDYSTFFQTHDYSTFFQTQVSFCFIPNSRLFYFLPDSGFILLYSPASAIHHAFPPTLATIPPAPSPSQAPVMPGHAPHSYPLPG